MASRINVHAHGMSGSRPEITLALVEMLNKGVTPVVCQKGSVGACGDLSPMAQAALLLMGEGEAFYKGERLAGKEALDRAQRARACWAGWNCMGWITKKRLRAGAPEDLINDLEVKKVYLGDNFRLN